ncbi:mitogen-activated protein kinase 2, putative [Plasmodium chabaudi chabaudi]|uniref:Mitogen-activated protein kinase n=1 Tax=Plasmodium chabaudi chabaudi TaxID=31271 RepID=A0A4V0K898_PLACU|nr:mitogen-activated protein kinase 2, putative [Plasmodium chabaudi chabaudi]VTZ68714.1 mitogen-activated protein kinase 2, putative [Plasmodium chabaudi chabaudi]|eukprot:XP_742908.2 mitogen-activated protein kinase 2, putative [Plasmodium chabaudi chabaudi]
MLKKKKECSGIEREEKNTKKKNNASECLSMQNDDSTYIDSNEEEKNGEYINDNTNENIKNNDNINKKYGEKEYNASETKKNDNNERTKNNSNNKTGKIKDGNKKNEKGKDEKINIKEAIIKNVRVPANYVIKHLIGRGSYGYVYLAYDKNTERNVAIKKVNRMFEDLIDCKRILREITILNRLKSDYIIRLYDLIIPEDLLKFDELYIVLEIADSDLKKLFKTPIFLTEEHIKTILYNLLLGEKFIHESGIIHRDLKPANCLLNQDCSVKVCDFGLARTINNEKDVNIVNDLEENEEPGPHNKNLKKQLTSHVVTRWYRAPELILLQENYTKSIDIWSTGCIFAELLNMLQSHISDPTNRFPLFPGSSCFPLSPDRNSKKVHEKSNRDQLNIIFNIIGTPTEDDLKNISKPEVIKYIKLFPHRKPTNLKQKYSSISEDGINLLESMLKFNPNKRITIDQALDHPYLKDVRKKDIENFSTKKIILPFDDWMVLSETQLRYIFLKEVQSFHPELVIPPAFTIHENIFYNNEEPSS